MKRVAFFAFGALAVGYAVLLWSLAGLPFHDFPNHVARSVVMADLTFHGGERFGQVFSGEFRFIPYMLGDVMLTLLVEACGADAGARIWLILAVGSFPLAVGVYLRSTGSSQFSLLIGCLVSLYLATDWFFLMGFASFRVALSLVLLSLAAWQTFMRTGSASSYMLFLCLVVAGYLMHLSALVFAAVGIGAVSLAALVHKRVSLRRTIAGGLVIAALWGWYFFSAGAGHGGEVLERASIVQKIIRMKLPFFHLSTYVLLGLFLAGCAVMRTAWRQAWRHERFQNACVLVVAFFLVYAVLPIETTATWEIDSRALPLVWLFVLFATLAAAESVGAEKTAVIAVSMLLAAANLSLLWAELEPPNAVILEYRKMAAQVPPGARVLPVRTPAPFSVDPYGHAGAFVTIDAGGITPYLFSANRGFPMQYFRYRQEAYTPAAAWYIKDLPVDWPKIQAEYDYMLLRLPYDEKRIGVPTQVVAHNRQAALLKIVR